MVWPVGVLAVLAVVGGWIQFAAVWKPLTDFLDPAAEPLVEATGTQELLASVARRRRSASPGIGVAWALYGAQLACLRRRAAARVLEHKFYFDELYDAVFYRPAVAARAAAPRLRRAAR